MKKADEEFLIRLIETPSPSGMEAPLVSVLNERLLLSADGIDVDCMGSIHAYVFGGATPQKTKASDNMVASTNTSLFHSGSAPRVMLDAHIDEVGMMVKYISPEGFLSIASVGGVDAAVLPGMRVDVHAKAGVIRGVVGRKPIHLIKSEERKKVTPLEELFIDLGMDVKKVKEHVRVGDQITFGTTFEHLDGSMAAARAFDDKCGVWVAVRVLEELKRSNKLKNNVVFAGTTQEEIGTRGAEASAFALSPDIAIAIDVTHATDYQGIQKNVYGDIACGQGPVIARGPNSNPAISEMLIKIASDNNIPYQIEAEPGPTGTNARIIQLQKGGIPTALVSIPLRYMHTPSELVDLADVENCVKLLTKFILSLDENMGFVPSVN